MFRFASLGKAIVILLVTVFLIGVTEHTTAHGDVPPEANVVATASWSEREYEQYLVRLAEEKGAAHAFSVLHFVPRSRQVDTHHIAHQLGYVFYKEKGAAGLSECTSDFKNACMHAVVTQEFVTAGTGALQRFADVCSQKPRHTPQYWSCFHGVGHGILASMRYDYEAAVAACTRMRDIIGESDGVNIEGWQECVGSATMELMQGAHDRVAWVRAQEVFMPRSDVLMPCNAAFIPRDVRPACYKHLHSRFFFEVGSENGETYPSSEEKDSAVFAFCTRIPETDAESRDACYKGIGSIFLYFANDNDSHSFKEISNEALSEVHGRCAYAGDGRVPCTLSALRTVFNSGEDSNAAVRFCALLPEGELSKRCEEDLAELAREHLRGVSLAFVCLNVSERVRNACLTGFKW